MTQHAHYSGIDPLSKRGVTLHIADGLISATEPCGKANLPVLSPGLVDLQVNGYNGHDLNSGVLTSSDVEALSDALCRVGIAAYLPTLITSSEQDFCQRLSAIKQAQQTLPLSKQMIVGVHIEGPSISPKDGPRGAHPIKHIRPPSLEEFERWQNAAGGLIRMITIAPEVDGALEYICQLAQRGICMALGHCDASEEDIANAVGAGATMSTHLGNGINNSLPRHPNALWAQLSEDRLFTSLIVDGHHLPRSTVRSMIRAKGIDKVMLVSDSVTFAGMQPGKYSSPIGGDVEVSETGRVSVAGTPYLAGSGTNLLDVVCGFEAFVDMPFCDALIMATHNPAKLLGRSAQLTPGNRADFIVFDVHEHSGITSARDIIFNGTSVLS